MAAGGVGKPFFSPCPLDSLPSPILPWNIKVKCIMAFIRSSAWFAINHWPQTLLPDDHPHSLSFTPTFPPVHHYSYSSSLARVLFLLIHLLACCYHLRSAAALVVVRRSLCRFILCRTEMSFHIGSEHLWLPRCSLLFHPGNHPLYRRRPRWRRLNQHLNGIFGTQFE